MLEISRLQDKIASLQRMSAVFLTHAHSGHVDRDVRERGDEREVGEEDEEIQQDKPRID